MQSFRATNGLIVAAALATTLFSGSAAQAQTPATPAPTTPVATPSSDILSVPLPPHARLRLDVDARDEDILGVVKSFFSGMDVYASSLQRLRNAATITGEAPAPNGATVPSGQPVDIGKAAAILLFSDADLSTILDRIDRVRLVAFEPRRTNASRAGTSSLAERQAVIKFYEGMYIEREGGRRMVRGDFDDIQVLAVAFPDNGFAAVLQTPDISIVFRSDDYPDFSGVGPIAMARLAQMLANGK